MEIKLGNKVYILPDAKELTPEQNWKIVQLGRRISRLEERARDRYERDKQRDFASACQNYVTTNVTMMDISSKLMELLREVEFLEAEESLKNAKVEKPKYVADTEYNSIVENLQEAATTTMRQVDNRAREFQDMAEESLQTMSKKIGIEVPKNEQQRTYTLDDILKEYENIAPKKEYTQQEQKDMDGMISKFEENKRNSRLMNEKRHDVAEELQGNLSVINEEYKDTAVLENKGIFAKIRSFFGRNSSTKRIEKQAEKNKESKINDIANSIKSAFKSKSRKKESKEEIVQKYKDRIKGAIGASLAIVGIQVGVMKGVGAEPIDETVPSNLPAKEFSMDAINEVANIEMKKTPNNVVEFENVSIDNEKISIAIEKSMALYEEIRNLIGDYNKSITEEQCKSVINKFDEINSKDISAEDKRQELNEYLTSSDDVLTAEEKQQTVVAIKQSIDNEAEVKNNPEIVKVPKKTDKVVETVEIDWDNIKSIIDEKNAQDAQNNVEEAKQENINEQESDSDVNEQAARAEEVRKRIELIDKIFDDKSMPDSARESALKLNLQGVIDDDYIHDVMKDDNVSDEAKQKKLKDKILEDYKETLIDDELKSDYDIINAVMDNNSIPSNDAKNALAQNLEYADETAISNILSVPSMTNEEKKVYLKQIVNNNYEISTLDEDVKKAYDIVDSIMNSSSIPDGQIQSTVVNNLKEYIPEETINEIFNKYALIVTNAGGLTKETINDIIEYELKNEVIKLQYKKGYEDIYGAIEDTVGKVPSEQVENVLYSKLSTIEDMKVAIDEGDIDLKDLANQINQSKDPSYVIVNNVGSKLAQVRQESELTEQEEDLKDILEKNIGNATVEELEDKIDDLYPLDDMKAIGFLQENDIKNIVDNENLSQKEKTRQVMKKITDANEQYDKLGFGKQYDKDKTDEYER